MIFSKFTSKLKKLSRKTTRNFFGEERKKMNVQDNRMINSPMENIPETSIFRKGVEYVKIRYWSLKA